MKHYVFECVDDEEHTRVTVDFSTENDSWSGYDGPMYKFHDFLKGCGFVFHMESQIGVIDGDGEFISAEPD